MIHSKRLSWAGHLEQMEANTAAKKYNPQRWKEQGEEVAKKPDNQTPKKENAFMFCHKVL